MGAIAYSIPGLVTYGMIGWLILQILPAKRIHARIILS